MELEILKNYKLNIDRIDYEHYVLFSSLEELNSKIISNICTVEDFNTFFEMFSRHVKYEEAYMFSINYPYLGEHFRQHVNMLEAFRKSFIVNANDAIKNRYEISKIEALLLDHIDHHDLQIGNYVNEKLIK